MRVLILVKETNSDLGHAHGENLILVVDDDADTRRLFIEGLAGHGWSCIPAQSVAEALAVLKTSRIALTVLDWDLIDGTGTAVLREAKLYHPLMPVVVVSGQPHDVRTDALLAQADAYLDKPVCLTVLQSQVRQLLKLSESARRRLNPETPDDIRPFSEVKAMYIRQAVQLLNGNVSLAAEKLGLHRHTVATALKPSCSADAIAARQPVGV